MRDANALTLETTTPVPTNANGLWWNPNESGWGLTFTQQANLIFVAMYTYGGVGAQRWFTSSNCIVAGDGCAGDLYIVNGGLAPAVPWNAALAEAKVGLFTRNLPISITPRFRLRLMTLTESSKSAVWVGIANHLRFHR
jgi:hypothetical protein